MRPSVFRTAIAAAAAIGLSADVGRGQSLLVRVTVENLAPVNSISLAPLRFGFGTGMFDAFDVNQPAFLLGEATIADAPIVSIAEGGSGATWFPAFQAAEPNADLGSVLGPTIPPFLPGQSSSAVFSVNPANRFFTFGTMVVPSNDHFLGNDNPMAYEVFDGAGNLILPSIVDFASRIWDAGSETQNPANAAFLVGSNNDLREDENQPVTFDFAGLATFNGLTTAAGYTFDSTLLTANTPVLRISFAVVPEPSAAALAWFGSLALVCRRRSR
ncbi:MAG TPA: spondin domain-containing protein [Lacipirellulaceae bacterium]|nr:spondin domain-containing protein [Lacipirellulaceae bacterium]